MYLLFTLLVKIFIECFSDDLFRKVLKIIDV